MKINYHLFIKILAYYNQFKKRQIIIKQLFLSKKIESKT